MDWPKELIESIALRDCVIFLGAGVSMNSSNSDGNNPKSWEGFLRCGLNRVQNTIKKSLIEKEIDKGDYLLACELLKMELGKGFINLLKDEFVNPQFDVADIHKDIFKLDSRFVITPNFDKIYDSYAVSESHGTVVIKKHTENDIVDSIRRRERIIIKMHGTIDAPNELMFSLKDYAVARTEHAIFYRVIESLLMTKTFIFIGAGINDPDVKLLLENNASMYQTALEHFFIIPKDSLSEDCQKVYSNIYNIKFLHFNKDNNYKELLDSIYDLVGLVDEAKSDISSAQSW